MTKKTKADPSFISAREIAYIALLAAKKEERFINETLNHWIRDKNPSQKDISLAREIAYGACRMGLSLDYIAKECSTNGKLSLKAKERVLLHTALYQHIYLEKIPLYAIANESLEIARKYCHPQFVKFLNATLRKLEAGTPNLPKGNAPEQLSIRYSYPIYFIDQLLKTYGLEKTISLLEAGNHASSTLFRVRETTALESWPVDSYSFLPNTEQKVAVLNDPTHFNELSNSPHLYIQNATPVALMQFLHNPTKLPATIVDLCASPGGKLILAHDLYPNALLSANDVSSQKLERLQQNLTKYALTAFFNCGQGQQFPTEQTFDLIILDAPCSNTGVLNKRPEARWRLSAESVQACIKTQIELLTHAKKLLSPEGEIWYMTCSILPEENQQLIDEICKSLNLSCRLSKTILSDINGWDGGFGCALTLNND